MRNRRKHSTSSYSVGEGAPLRTTPGCANFIGGPPALLLSAAAKVPYGVDEYGITDALNGAPIDVVDAETNSCQIPANAEIVIEGRVD